MSGKDGKDVADENAKRRRRKGGGLRVPSDNVPRPSTGSETTAAEMSVQPTKDPRLAVSVAYALGEDGENTDRQPSASTFGSVPERQDGALPPHESVDIDVDDFDEEESARAAAAAAQRPLASLPVSDSRAATIIDESMAERAAELDRDEPELRPPSEPSGSAPAGKAARRANQRWPRVQTEALSDDDLQSLVVDGESGDSRLSSQGDELEDDDIPTKVSELPQLDEEDGGAEVAAPRVAVDGDRSGPAPAPPQTAALPAPQAPAPPRAPAPPPPAPLDPTADARASLPAPLTGKRPTLGGARLTADEAPTVPTDEVVASDGATVPAAVAALEDRIGAPSATPRAGDSGEILADELIEELEEQDRATEAPVEISSAELEEVADASAESAGEGEKKVPPPAPTGGAAPASAAPKAKARRKPKPWFEEIFDEDYLRTLPFLTPQTTQAEANFVIDSLAADPGAQILDVGCGYGRHAMELAARGYHVVGLDSSLPLLLRGADEAQRRGLNINFVHGDMRELSFEAQFDGAYCLFSTFGYFDDETNKKTAQNIARALKPGARFVIEVLNRDYIIGDLPSRVWWEGDGCVVLEEVEFNYFSSRILSHRSVVFDDGHQLEQEISIRAYSLHELGKLLHAAGFRVIEISGGMHSRGRFFGGRSRDIVVVAERRTKSSSDDGRRVKTEAGVGKV